MEPKSDEKLMQEWLEGDLRASDELAGRYLTRIQNYQYALVGDRSLAWDLTQETFLKLIRSKNSVDTSRPFSAYLFRIAQTTGISWFRIKARRLFVPLADHDCQVGANDVDNMLAVEQAVSRLSLRLRRVHELRMEGFTNSEIAYILRTSLRTVVSQNAKIERSLYKTLTQPAVEPSLQAPASPPKKKIAD